MDCPRRLMGILEQDYKAASSPSAKGNSEKKVIFRHLEHNDYKTTANVGMKCSWC